MAVLALGAPSAASAQPVPPDAEYRVLETEHFRVTFPSALGELAPVASAHAERAHELLSGSFLPAPSSTIDLLLTDHLDSPGGVARIFPSPRMVIYAQPPVEGLALSNFETWLELVILHELVHIFHLDHSGTPGAIVRAVMGRVPWTWPAFPGYAVAPLGIEGVAVHLESTYTSAGRVHGGYHDAIVRTQALGSRLGPVDQGLGRSPVWPGGDRPYVLGGEFVRHLSETYGEPAVVDFLDTVASQWIPYRLDAAAREVFGVELAALWSEWTEGVEAEATAVAVRIRSSRERAGASGFVGPEILTEGARYGLHPAADPAGASVAFVRADGRNETALVLLEGGEERAVARWNGLDPPRWTPDGDLLVPQPEYVDNYRILRDLYRVSLSGEVTRVTSGLRVLHADPHPSNGTTVAVLSAEGTTRLVVLSATGEELRALREPTAGVVWSYPAWSPSGDRLAVVRRRESGLSAIVVMDSRGEILHELGENRSLNTAPAWGPDGNALAWSSDRSGIPNLYGVRWPDPDGTPTGVQQVTDVVSAVSFPTVAPEGDWIYLSVLSDDGWEIGRVPYDPEDWRPAPPPEPRYLSSPEDALVDPGPSSFELSPTDARAPGGAAASEEASRPYSAFPTVLPRYWEPTLDQRATVLGRTVLPDAWGLRTSGTDLVGRHEYAAAFATPLEEFGSQSDWSALYRWRGLGNPSVVLETAQSWDTRSGIPVDPDESGGPEYVAAVSRERWLGGAVELRRSRARVASILTLGARSIRQDRYVFELDGEPSDRYELARPSTRLTEARAAVGVSTARSYPFSVSLEDGVTATAALRQRWDTMVPDSLSGRAGLDGALREAFMTFRAYRGLGGPGYADHVVALRAAAGVADGPGAGAGHFAIGGRESGFPVRGLLEGILRGRRAWGASLEWRFPVVVVNRGLGAWPLFVDRVAGALFFDAAGAERNPGDAAMQWDTRISVGLEVVTTVSVFFEGLDRLRVGLAVPLGPAGDRTGRAALYLATGWSF